MGTAAAATVTAPNYTFTFPFEREFDHTENYHWMTENWTQCFYYIGAYMVIIFGGQMFMQNRPAYDLKKTLFFWNLFLAAFSIVGASRTLPEMIYSITQYGFKHSVCVPSFMESDRVSAFWSYMFIMSKVPELGDTVFIVLRKRPLIFLHWYHHVTVLVYTWYAYSQYTAPGRWFIVMNYVAHTVMYTYYAMRAINVRVPKFVAMLITTIQLSQMVIGCYVNSYSYFVKERGEKCTVTYENIKFSLLMYFSYFVLFARFFYQAYIKKSSRSEKLKCT